MQLFTATPHNFSRKEILLKLSNSVTKRRGNSGFLIGNSRIFLSMMSDYVMDLDLNQQSSDSPLPKVLSTGSSLNGSETCSGEIGDRIRFLEAVTGRAIQRRRHERQPSNNEMAERGKRWKSDSSHLVAKALEMDGEVNNVEKEGCLYDCSICSETARIPVVTCCGHLFCWACFYHMNYVDSTCKECPVCEGEVSDGSVIPVYGNGDELESGPRTPPRPKARRVESVRQRRGLDVVPVAEALRRIRIGIGAMVD